ncbi:TPA: SMC-Scp complex subunit ScpB [Candidatus Woesearchaeota archaeon]|nr:SMC-Scp complex subunit ScpB [Candidatus Woesearchaeota archaeon]HII88807.1 SMC-Scp complex subunit ScpB [Candidatus Woesearchaeota archaeon]
MKNIAEQPRNQEEKDHEEKAREEEQKSSLSVGELKKRVQAILFAAGRSVSCEELCSLLGVATPGLVKEAVKELKEEINSQGSLVLVEEGVGQTEGWKLAVKDPYAELVKKITPHTEMDKALLETLAVIAWRHPALQADVIKIRTSQAYEHIAHLVELGFIVREKKGNTFVLKPTQKFLDYFDLPSKEAVKALFKDIPAQIKEKYKDRPGQGQTSEQAGPKKVGQLDVYKTGDQEAQPTEFQPRSAKELGPLGLEVVDEPEEKNEEESEGEQEEGTEEELAKQNQDEQEEGEQHQTEDEGDDHSEDEEPPKKQKQEEPKRKLSKDLEDFANGS